MQQTKKRSAHKVCICFILIAILATATAAGLLCPGNGAYSAFADEQQGNESANSWRYSNEELVSSEDGASTDILSAIEELGDFAAQAILSWTWHPDYEFYIADGYDQFTGGYYTGTSAKRGIDVSQWQGWIDWSTTRNYIDYAIIRCGYGYNLTYQDDTRWSENVDGCISNGIPFGVYIYSYATNTSMAQSEAEHALRCLSDKGLTPADVDYPIYLDLEQSGTEDSDFAAIAQTFCGTIEAAGYEAGVYASTSWWNNYLTSSTFNQWSKWAAQWSSQGYGLRYDGLSDFENSQGMWQFSDYGDIPGISGRVDLDYTFYEKPNSNEPTAESLDIGGLSVRSDIAYIDGAPVSTTVNGSTVSLQVPTGKHTVVLYSYNTTSGDAHSQYPTNMYVWMAKPGKAGSRITRCSALDNVLIYAGSSIRITGNKGIRMITSIPVSSRNSLINSNLDGYTLQEYGTVVAWDSSLGNETLTLNSSAAKSAYAFKRGEIDALFSQDSSVAQYTNVLTGFSLEQCSPDLSMRPYMKLTDSSGTVLVLYGGIVHRSIGYIAKQNENSFSAGTDAYNYIHEIIDSVYGN